MSRRIAGIPCVFSVTIALALQPTQSRGTPLERIRISNDQRGFVADRSGTPFQPWGFNYDHDSRQRLLEDYWDTDWPEVVDDFREMKRLGANLVRIHLQIGKFLKGPEEPNVAALERLSKLVTLAEETGLYLDITGLGCYRKADVPPWYDALDERGRWAAQAFFWRTIAARCASSPAIFCFDLMNEPVVPGGRRKERDWLGPPFGDFCFVQCITLDQRQRPRPEIARAWIETLVAAIRAVDPKRLVTVGMVDWSLERPGLTSGFVPATVAGRLDFLSVHLYPEAGKVDKAIDTLKGFAETGKPVLIEETFPLRCSLEDFRGFLVRSKPYAAGWVGFYWGKTIDEYRPAKTIADALMLGWLEMFRKGRP